MKTIRVKEEWQRAGVYYVRTQAMVLGFNLSLEGEFADDSPDGKYILVATISTARGLGAGAAGILAAEDWIRELGYSHIVITSRKEAEGFYHKLGYITREDMNPDTLELKKPSDPVREVRDPRFICVYMEKQL